MNQDQDRIQAIKKRCEAVRNAEPMSRRVGFMVREYYLEDMPWALGALEAKTRRAEALERAILTTPLDDVTACRSCKNKCSTLSYEQCNSFEFDEARFSKGGGEE